MPSPLNPDFDYHRLVIGYHGCDEEVGREIILGDRELKASENRYDWLGAGIYFWEHGPNRAIDWARSKVKRDQSRVENGKLSKEDAVTAPYAVGGYLYLGRCLDLTDTFYTETLSRFYPIFEQVYRQVEGEPPPKNKKRDEEDEDFIFRQGDCAFLNWFLGVTDKFQGQPEEMTEIQQLDFDCDETYFHTVRGLFTEGEGIYEGSGITKKGHIQISVREEACILGVFRPHFEGTKRTGGSR